ETVEVHLCTKDLATSLASVTINPSAGTWTSHSVQLSPSVDVDEPQLAVYLKSAGTVKIDEIRISESGSLPAVNSDIKNSIRDLGVTMLCWPGGTLTDWYSWQDFAGSLISRGETRAYGYYETPALGLHEFLNLCEELSVEPLVQVNVLDSPSDNADLVEYILGSESTTQGSLRKANGRSSSWNVRYFEIGNEPVSDYGAGVKADAGSNYALLAKDVIHAMKARAASLGKTITVGVVSEAAFQMADWMVSGLSDDVDLLYNWNSQVFSDSNGLEDISGFTHGHFYSSRYYSGSEETDFVYAMTGGALLMKTVSSKIKNHTALPVWITEYHSVLEDGSNKIQTAYLKNFQSGLAVADILISMINGGIEYGCMYNLIDCNGFGMVLENSQTRYRPTGIVFKLFSVMAGEQRLAVSVDNNEEYSIITGHGNVPAGFSYPLISAAASKNSVNGKPRVILVNRDYSSDKTVTVTLESFVPGNAAVVTYSNAD
ncbi:MAG TPA: hypothetical protein PK544_12980, partial [Spirochaetota bacterium]|nr:hypothetical protein [Spirochaetota bacterium]